MGNLGYSEMLMMLVIVAVVVTLTAAFLRGRRKRIEDLEKRVGKLEQSRPAPKER